MFGNRAKKKHMKQSTCFETAFLTNFETHQNGKCIETF